MKTTIAAAIAATSLAVIADATPAGSPPPGADSASEEKSALSFDAGASVRTRQEVMHNVPAAMNGMLGRPGVARGKTKNQLRIRPSVWAEVKYDDMWRIYARVTDEFRAGLVQKTHNQTFPCELVLDNLFFEGKGFFDGFLDVAFGRQDIYRLYGLDHIFVDGTPGDGSCSVHADLFRVALNFTETERLDLFGIYNADQDELRWGTKRSRHLSKTGFGRGDREMDDWGYGAIWNSRFDFIDCQLFYIGKGTKAFHVSGEKHPWKFTNLLGMKVVPHWTETFSTPVETMAQVGRNGDGEALHAWAAYAGFDWKMEKLSCGVRPFWNGGVLVLSGDKNAANEDGGKSAWDPMWYRGVDDGEMFLYGSLYGCGWWSNLVNPKTTFGLEFGYHHAAQLTTGPMFVETKDGVGGGNGRFKGYFTQAKYEFPIYISSKDEGGRLEIFGHVLGEIFNPGDYYDTDKPAYFVRWQVEVKF